MVEVTVWNEYRHERENDAVREIYPDGIHAAIATGLRERGHAVGTATLDEPEHGLDPETVAETDVLCWWGHRAHDEVDEAVVDRVQEAVLDGMGLLVLHSGHYATVFKRLMGTTCSLKWRESGDTERLWVTDPSHPIADGVDDPIELQRTETYGEHFDVPQPDSVVFTSWFSGGEVFRSCCTFTRGNGRIVYVRPGHESYPIYHDETVLDVLDNAVRWAAPGDAPDVTDGNVDAPEGE